MRPSINESNHPPKGNIMKSSQLIKSIFTTAALFAAAASSVAIAAPQQEVVRLATVVVVGKRIQTEPQVIRLATVQVTATREQVLLAKRDMQRDSSRVAAAAQRATRS
jgi:hypothetical protein